MSLKICHVMLPLLVIVLNILLVQSIHSKEFNQNTDQSWSDVRVPLNNALHQSKHPNSVKNFVSNKDDVYKTALFIDSIYNDRFDRSATSKWREVVDPRLRELKELLMRFLSGKKIKRDMKKLKRVEKSDVGRWEKWNEWSTCSVSCGKGRQIRWRNCLENCDGIETEMEEKTCQLPDCARGLFGFV